MRRSVWLAVLITSLFVILAGQIAGWVTGHSAVVRTDTKGLVSSPDRPDMVLAGRLLVLGIASVVGVGAGLLARRRKRRLANTSSLAMGGLLIPRIARRRRTAQDAVRMLEPGRLALPRRRRAGKFFRSAVPAAEPGGSVLAGSS